MCCICRESGKAAGAVTTQIDDILGRGEPDLFQKARMFSEELFWKLKAQEGPSATLRAEAWNWLRRRISL